MHIVRSYKKDSFQRLFERWFILARRDNGRIKGKSLKTDKIADPKFRLCEDRHPTRILLSASFNKFKREFYFCELNHFKQLYTSPNREWVNIPLIDNRAPSQLPFLALSLVDQDSIQLAAFPSFLLRFETAAQCWQCWAYFARRTRTRRLSDGRKIFG